MRGKGLVLGAMGALLLFAAPASGASKNVKLLDTLPEAKDATAINFLEYDKKGWGKHKRELDVMLVTGRFGLKSYSLEDPRHPELLDEVTAEELRLPGDPPVNPVGDPRAGTVHVLAERGHGRRSRPQARAPVARPARLRGLDHPRAG